MTDDDEKSSLNSYYGPELHPALGKQLGPAQGEAPGEALSLGDEQSTALGAISRSPLSARNSETSKETCWASH